MLIRWLKLDWRCALCKLLIEEAIDQWGPDREDRAEERKITTPCLTGRNAHRSRIGDSRHETRCIEMIRGTNCLFALVALVAVSACATSTPPERATAVVDPVSLIERKFDHYHAGNWAAWINQYGNNARIYYNTTSRPMTATQAAAVHERSVQPLSSYRFRPAETSIIATIDNDGRQWVYFTSVWHATFRATGESVAVPTAMRFRLDGDRIVEEHGYWDNGLMSGAYQRAADAR